MKYKEILERSKVAHSLGKKGKRYGSAEKYPDYKIRKGDEKFIGKLRAEYKKRKDKATDEKMNDKSNKRADSFKSSNKAGLGGKYFDPRDSKLKTKSGDKEWGEYDLKRRVKRAIKERFSSKGKKVLS